MRGTANQPDREQPWSTILVGEGDSIVFSLGILRVHCSRKGSLLMLESTHAQMPGPEDFLSWQMKDCAPLPYYSKHASSVNQSDLVQIRPVLPATPLVIKLRSSLLINRENPVSGFIVVPVGVSFSLNRFSYQDFVLEAFSIPFSQTWLGMQDQGEIAWSYKTDFLSEEPEQIEDYEVVIPIHLEAVGSSYIEIEQLVLRPGFFNIYKGGEGHQLYTDQQQILLQDAQTEKSLHILKGGLAQLHSLDLLTEARNPNKKNMIASSFSFFKSIY